MRLEPTESISSMKITQGARSFAASASKYYLIRNPIKAILYLLNKSRTRLAPCPTRTSSNSGPAAWKNGTLASPATALAKRVLPVPGGPFLK